MAISLGIYPIFRQTHILHPSFEYQSGHLSPLLQARRFGHWGKVPPDFVGPGITHVFPPPGSTSREDGDRVLLWPNNYLLLLTSDIAHLVSKIIEATGANLNHSSQFTPLCLWFPGFLTSRCDRQTWIWPWKNSKSAKMECAGEKQKQFPLNFYFTV